MFAIDHDMRVHLSGEVQCLCVSLQMQQLQYLALFTVITPYGDSVLSSGRCDCPSSSLFEGY